MWYMYWGSMICASWLMIPTFFFKLLPLLFQNIQACLINIDLNTKLGTRIWWKIFLMSIYYCGIIYMYLNRYCLKINHYTAFIFFSRLIVDHNGKHKLSIPLKYKVLLLKHKCSPLPFFLCFWDQRSRVVGYCF